MPTGTPTGWRRSLLAALACADVADAVEFFVELADAQSVRRLALADIAGHGSVKLGRLDSSGSTRSLEHGYLRTNALKADDAVHPIARDRRLILHLESELNEELDSIREVGDDYVRVVHPLDRHVLDGRTRKARGNASAITGPNARSTGVARLRNTLTRDAGSEPCYATLRGGLRAWAAGGRARA